MKMTGENKYLERNPSQYQFVHHKAHTESPTLETGPPDATDRRLITSPMARLIQGSEIMRHDGSLESLRITVVIFDTKTGDRRTNIPCVKRCLWVKNYRSEARERREHVTLPVHPAGCLTTGPQSPHSADSSLHLQYPLVSSRPSSSCSRLLSRLPFTFTPSSIFPSIMCFRRQLLAYNEPYT